MTVDGAAVSVNGGSYATVVSGNPSGALLLNPGSNSVNVRVTSPDLNGDGARTLLDLLQWSIDVTTGNLEGDLNSDGLVNDADLTILLGAL